MDSYSGSGTNQNIDQKGSVLPGYVPYLSLVFKLIATTVILLLSGWVVYTIKTTRSLHKPHNVLVANLLVSGMIAPLIGCTVASTMIISYQLGVESFIDCSALRLYLLPAHVNNMSLVIIAADKVLAITSPFKHKRMKTPRVVAAVITGAWLLALLPTALIFAFVADGYSEVAEYGICLPQGAALLQITIIYLVPIMLGPVLAIALNVYLAIKAYKVHKQIKNETRLAGTTDSQSERVTSLRKIQRNIMRHKKPIITLLVVVFGSTAISLFFSIWYLLGRILIDSKVYDDVWELVISRNIPYVSDIFLPLVYGIYFKQVRDPMMRRWKRFWKMNKVNTVAPQ